MVPITETSDSGDVRSADDGSTPTATLAERERSETLLCWICRQPLSEAERVYWRGEPIHRDCP